MISFHQNHLEWLSFSFRINLTDSEWKKLLKKFKIKDQKGEFSNQIDLKETSRNDYHVHLLIEKFSEKKKYNYRMSIGFHIEPKKKIYNKNYNELKTDSIQKEINEILPLKKITKLKVFCLAKYIIDVKKIAVSETIPIGKTLNIPPQVVSLGNTEIAGFQLKFEDSEIGLERIEIEKFDSFISLDVFFKLFLDLSRDFLSKFLELSNSVRDTFIQIKNK